MKSGAKRVVLFHDSRLHGQLSFTSTGDGFARKHLNFLLSLIQLWGAQRVDIIRTDMDDMDLGYLEHFHEDMSVIVHNEIPEIKSLFKADEICEVLVGGIQNFPQLWTGMNADYGVLYFLPNELSTVDWSGWCLFSSDLLFDDAVSQDYSQLLPGISFASAHLWEFSGIDSEITRNLCGLVLRFLFFPQSRCSCQIDSGVWQGEGAVIASATTLDGPVVVGNNAIIEEGCEIGPTVIVGNGAVIHAGAVLSNTVVGPHVCIPPQVICKKEIIGKRYFKRIA
jgi:hypothetical protein